MIDAEQVIIHSGSLKVTQEGGKTTQGSPIMVQEASEMVQDRQNSLRRGQ